jgi:hypothetical protein
MYKKKQFLYVVGRAPVWEARAGRRHHGKRSREITEGRALIFYFYFLNFHTTSRKTPRQSDHDHDLPQNLDNLGLQEFTPSHFH